MVEHLLHGSPVSAAGIDLVCNALVEVAARWPASRRLRVLELGADGGATRRLLDHLAQSGVALSYQATNPDPEQASRLGSIVAAVAGASASCWSPDDPADELGAGPFDIVLSVHASARLQLDAAALAQLRDQLAPGGLFITVEAEPNPLWDIVFGRYGGWWQGDRCGDHSPLRSGEEWRDDLAIAGFAEPGAAAVASGPWPSCDRSGAGERRKPTVVAAQPSLPRTISLIAAGGDYAALGDQVARAGHRVSMARRSCVCRGPGRRADRRRG